MRTPNTTPADIPTVPAGDQAMNGASVEPAGNGVVGCDGTATELEEAIDDRVLGLAGDIPSVLVLWLAGLAVGAKLKPLTGMPKTVAPISE